MNLDSRYLFRKERENLLKLWSAASLSLSLSHASTFEQADADGRNMPENATGECEMG